MMLVRQRITLAAASLTSFVGLAMAAAAAMDRGGNTLDRALIIAVACVLVLGAHLLPTISSSWKARTLWVGCLVLTAWGHAVFFTSAATRAGQARSDAVATTGRAQALQAELQAIQARPLAIVSAEAAASKARADAARAAAARCQTTAMQAECRRRAAIASAAALKASALADELDQARRANDLRSQLTAAATGHDAARQQAAADPVAHTLANLTGLSADGLSTAVAVLSSVIVELMAALLWSTALASPTTTATIHHAHEVITHAAPQQTTQADQPAADQPDHPMHGLRPAQERTGRDQVPRTGRLRPMHSAPINPEDQAQPQHRPSLIQPSEPRLRSSSARLPRRLSRPPKKPS